MTGHIFTICIHNNVINTFQVSSRGLAEHQKSGAGNSQEGDKCG